MYKCQTKVWYTAYLGNMKKGDFSLDLGLRQSSCNTFSRSVHINKRCARFPSITCYFLFANFSIVFHLVFAVSDKLEETYLVHFELINSLTNLWYLAGIFPILNNKSHPELFIRLQCKGCLLICVIAVLDVRKRGWKLVSY